MNTAIRCIVLLACVVVCISQPIINCRCLTTTQRVNLSLITGITVINPSPYCDKKQVIVRLKGRGERCLDPRGKFAQALVEYTQKFRAIELLSPTFHTGS
uniref:C-X-C motif chemokine n=1 Tax=Lates calcarifer TaxID=8187 RepID=A0A4W6D939_LATCA